MIRALLLLLLLTHLPIDTPTVVGTIAPGETDVFPETARTLVVRLETKQPLWALVLQVHITGAISAAPNDDGACSGMGRDERGEPQETVCTWLNVPAGTVVTRTITLSPIHIVTNPIRAACMTQMQVGIPFTLDANGETIAYRQTVWTAYHPGYCRYLTI